MLYTRSDIAYTLNIISRFQTDPEENHQKAMKNILNYLGRTRDIFLIYGRSNLKLEGYIESSFQSNPDDSKSISRYVFTLYGREVNWKSFKQQTVADSITEIEYITTSEATK